MALSFEKPQDRPEGEEKKTSPESREQRRSDEYFEQAQQEIIDFLTDGIEAEVSIRLAEDPTFRAKGRNWELNKLPDEYREIAFMQKKLQLIDERLGEVLAENDQTEPSTAEEATSYFAAQLLARVRQAQEAKINRNAEMLGLQIQHPAIAEALKEPMKKAA